MLSVSKLIASALECLGWPYVSPGSNDKNGIDCSGLWVKCFRDQGSKIYHGSNTIFREYCTETGKLTSASQLKPGMAVFKCKPWTDADRDNRWYGTEPGNLSHIGMVTSVNKWLFSTSIVITHATSPVVTQDKKIGKWAYWGKIKGVDYGDSPSPDPVSDPEPTPETKTMYVYAENGKPVNMRRKASKQAALVERVPVGASVIWQKNDGNGWAYVKYHGFVGWMMEQFLQEDVPAPVPDSAPEQDPEPAGILYDVYSENGKPVRMRAEPNTDCRLYDEVPSGAQVEMLVYNHSTDKKGNQWSKISYGVRKGWYMMSKFLSVG